MPLTQQKKYPNSGRDRKSQAVILAEMAVAGNPNAFDQLVDLYYNTIFRMVYYRIRSGMDAEDVTQDIFTQVLKNIKSLKDFSLFNSWLFSIAVNRVRDFKRKKRFASLFGVLSDKNTEKEQEYEHETSAESGPLESVIRQNFWKQFESILNRLSSLEKEVFLLRFLDQLGIREISMTLKKNESTVKTHLYRALKKIKDDSSVKELLKESMP
ncbi:MAG: RNA polymerase sigma factor [Pseudomonadota bacterium]|nr:RNA polymerase sigma factor [Pseudomonadota bacterium]MBU1398522.1 RNA polymerase sigma factor [Pseudomonadota bacterium]MBU1570720.1 RNA polymerase sigma factor [Pseudomonadota bacterium]